MIQIPVIHPIEEYVFPKMEKCMLSNETPYYVIPYGPEEMVRVDCVIEAGTLQQAKFFVASFTHRLQREGTLQHTSKEIAELLDFYGASFLSSTMECHTVFTLLTLPKHLTVLLPLFREILFEPTFPEDEFELLQKSEKQSFELNESKVTTMAHRGLKRCIYGADGTLGKAPQCADYDRIELDDIRNFYATYCSIDYCTFFLSGNASSAVRKELDACFGQLKRNKETRLPLTPYVEYPSADRKLYIEKANSVQSAVFVGKRLFPLSHPDFHKVSILNTVLGGYFGSRLMTNIREEKGYTYGINSALRRSSKGVLAVVATQTATQYVQPLLVELYKEMDRLCEELVPEEELDTVKNYLLGDMLRSVDGSFSIVDAYIGLTLEHEDVSDFYGEKLKTIQTITSQDLLAVAQQYFRKEEYYEVIAGKRE